MSSSFVVRRSLSGENTVEFADKAALRVYLAELNKKRLSAWNELVRLDGLRNDVIWRLLDNDKT